jgi:hypothetical protein
VIDALVGFVYAAVGYAFVMHVMPRLQSFLAKRVPEGSRRRARLIGASTHHFTADDERPGDASTG